MNKNHEFKILDVLEILSLYDIVHPSQKELTDRYAPLFKKRVKLLGMCDTENMELSIANDMTIPEIRKVLIHELTHAHLYRLGEFGYTHNEHYVNSITKRMYEKIYGWKK